MKKLLQCVGIIALTGCASYITKQEDNKVGPDGKVVAQTKTTVSVWTFFSAKSELAKSSVSQTDKTQSSKIGAVNQEATNNIVQDMTALINAAKK